MRLLALVAALVSVGLQAQAATTVWLRGTPPPVTKIVSPGCTAANPIVCTVEHITSLVAGQTINVMGVCSASSTNHISNANGIRKIGAVSGSTVSLQANDGTVGVPNGTPINGTGNGAWCDGALASENPFLPGQQSIAVLTAFSRVTGLSGWFDGDTGPTTRKWSNEPASLIVTGGNLATVTTSYNHGLTSLDLVRIWGTTNSTLSATGTGSEFTVTVTGPTTYTFPISISNGDYTHNNACGPPATPNNTIGGAENCVRISQLAVSTNWAYIQERGRAIDIPSGAYKWAFSGGGGTLYGADVASGAATDFALWFLLDQSNQNLLTASIYYQNNLELMAGGNFFANANVGDGGIYDLSAQVSSQSADFMRAHAIVHRYMTGSDIVPQVAATSTAQKALDKLLADIADPTPATATYPLLTATNSGTTIAGSSTTITLAAGASGANNFYNNQVVEDVLASTAHTLGTVTAYNGTTKVATVANWSNGTPANGDTYSVWETGTLSSTAAGATVTITGVNTHWNSAGPDQVHVGDSVMLLNSWRNVGFFNPGTKVSYVTAITDDTHVSAINGNDVWGSTSTPQAVWVIPHWVPGNAGMQWQQNNWTGVPGSQPISYPPRGGTDSLNADFTIRLGSNIQGNLADYGLDEMMQCVEFDTRCLTNLARYSVIALDENVNFSQGYITGFVSSGVNYGTVRGTQGVYSVANTLANSVVGLPGLDRCGPWVTGFQTWKQYALWPDSPFSTLYLVHDKIMAYYGIGAANSHFGRGFPASYAMILDYGIIACPTSTSSKYVNYFQQNVLQYNSAGASSAALTEISLKIDPRNPTLDYTTQPYQYLFQSTSYSAAAALTGWNYPATWRGDGVISRTGFLSASDTHVQFQARSFYLDHDFPEPGSLYVHKVGELLSTDLIPPGDIGDFATPQAQPTLEFGGVNTFRIGNGNSGGVAVANITAFSGTPPYGDPNSNYVCALADVSGSYNPSPTRGTRWMCDAKDAGTEQIIATYTDVAVASPVIIRDQLLYPQNGETTGVHPLDEVIYPEGDTGCPGAGGCPSIDTNRSVLEQEDGLCSNGDPCRVYNLISKFFSPGTIKLNWDGTSYAGASGHAYRLSIYGGSTVGGTASSLESLAIHKVATQPDVTLTAVSLTPDSNWFGAQTADKVFLFSRGGVTHAVITPFTTTHSGTARYIFAGLTAGSYTVTVGGVVKFAGTTGAGDTTISFLSTSGAVVVAPLVTPGVNGMRGTTKASGNAVIR